MLSGDILGERARLTPDKTALIHVPTGQRFSYRQLNERAIGCARVWRNCRLRKGDRVGILAHNRVEYLDAFFAAGKSGIILVPLSTRLTARELEAIVRDAGLKCLMYGAEAGEAVRSLQETVEVGHYIALDCDDASGGEVLSYARAVAKASGGGWQNEPCDPEDIYCLLYTSGTTGKPKGVMLPHRMVVFNGYNTVASWQLRDDDISPIFTPLYHAGGLSVFLVPLFTVGGTIVLHERFDASEAWQAIERERCTVVFGVPTTFKMMMDAPEFERADLSHVRWFISGGAPLPLYVLQAYQRRGVIFKQGYGLTEVGVNCFAATAEDSACKLGSIGKPMLHTEARLADSSGADVAKGEVGELWLRGPHVCKGYWNQPEATAAALDGQGWFHTGDLAHQDEDGFFYIAGRLKDMIISGGVNVYPAEIEAELVLHSAVADAAVVGVPHDTWGEVGVAFVVLRQHSTAEELIAYLTGRLGKYKVPKDVLFVDNLPRTPYGKVLKTELRERYLAKRDAQHG